METIRLIVLWAVALMLLVQGQTDGSNVLAQAKALRVLLYADPAEAVRKVCNEHPLQTRLLRCAILIHWRGDETWEPACEGRPQDFLPQRFYRLEVSCRVLAKPLMSIETILKR